MRPTELDEPASSAAFDRISETSFSVYLFDASLKGEPHADKEGVGANNVAARHSEVQAEPLLGRPD